MLHEHSVCKECRGGDEDTACSCSLFLGVFKAYSKDNYKTEYVTILKKEEGTQMTGQKKN